MKPGPLYFKARIVGNGQVDMRSSDDQGRPTKKACRLELKPLQGPYVPKDFPNDGKLVFYIADTYKEAWEGLGLGVEFSVLLRPEKAEEGK